MKTGKTARSADTARAFAALAIALVRGAAASTPDTIATEPNTLAHARKQQIHTNPIYRNPV